MRRERVLPRQLGECPGWDRKTLRSGVGSLQLWRLLVYWSGLRRNGRLASPRNVLRNRFYRLDMGDMRHVGKIREWLEKVLGPTAHVERYTDDYCVRRMRDMYGFYGSGIFLSWGGLLEWIG
jgi:hypothetical protein